MKKFAGNSGDVIFQCPKCSKRLVCSTGGIGRKFNCVSCGESIKIPKPKFSFQCSECNSELLACKNVIGGFFECPQCESRIAVPLKDPAKEIKQVIEEPQEEIKEDVAATFIDQGVTENGIHKMPILNEESEYMKHQKQKLIDAAANIVEKEHKKKFRWFFSVVRIAVGLSFAWLAYYLLSLVFHPSIAKGLFILALIITVPLYFKSKWLIGD